MAKKEPFEVKLKKLEEIVDKLESEDTPLEDSIKLFQEGKKLSDKCMKQLTEVEQKVSKLIDKKGTIKAVPFNDDNQ